MHRSRPRILRWLLCLLATSGCAFEVGDASEDTIVGRAEAPLYGVPNVTYWNDARGKPANVHVCWTRNATLGRDSHGISLAGTAFPGFATVKKWMREAVENSWGRAADIYFYGWDETCKWSGGSDDEDDAALNPNTIMLSFPWDDTTPNPNSPGNAYGRYSRITFSGRSDGVGSILFSNPDVASRQVWQHYTIHEMGHGLGFAHEQVRPDNWRNGTTVGCKFKEGPANGGEYLNVANDGSSWPDPESVMCYDVRPFELSAGDVMGVQRRYGRKVGGSVVGYGGRSIAIPGAVTTSNTQLIAWPGIRPLGVSGWHETWKAETVSSTGLEGFSTRTPNNTKLCWFASTAPGLPVVTAGCVNYTNYPYERFPRTNMLWRGLGNMCVTAASASIGQKLTLQRCSASTRRWDFFQPKGSQIRMTGTNLCVTMPKASPTLGDLPTLQTCLTSSATQTLSFGTHQQIRFGSLCMHVLGSLPNAGSAIGLWDGCNANPHLQSSEWNLTGFIKSPSNNYCVSLKGNAVADGTGIVTRACDPAPAPITTDQNMPAFTPQHPQEWDIYW